MDRRAFIKAGALMGAGLVTGELLPGYAAEDGSTEKQGKESNAMKIEKVAYGSWKEAYRCVNGDVEIVMVTEIGPRVMSLKAGASANLLMEDKESAIKRGDWYVRGGHRFWTSPETEFSYEPDNTPCKVTAEGGKLTVTGPVERSGLQKTIEVTALEGRPGFNVRHRLKNKSPMLAVGSVWAMSCVNSTGKILVSWGESDPNWGGSMIRFWDRWAGSTTDIESNLWALRNGYVVVSPSGETGKIGLFSSAGWLAHLLPETTFVKRAMPIAGAVYPDGGCNIEVYTSAAFSEMETLAPAAMLNPETEQIHDEEWVVLAKAFEPKAFKDVAKAAGMA